MTMLTPLETILPVRALIGLACFTSMLAWSSAQADEEIAIQTPTYVVRRAACPIVVDGRLSEAAWRATPEVGPFTFAWYKSGPKEPTQARLLWDDEHLYAAFFCHDAHVSAKFTRRDEPVYRDDCVEVFCAPNPLRGEAYFNFEMNARAMLLDQHHPRGRFSGLDQEWNSRGVRIATHVMGTLNDDDDEDLGWTLEVAIPWENFAGVARRLPPLAHDRWRLNLNRCGGDTNPQYSQWSPSMTTKPDFHRLESFGEIVFSNELAGATLAPQRPFRRQRRW
ncbi:MAG: carbohydrate-binding family 9-like protein [Pirellulaceae bacterium]